MRDDTVSTSHSITLPRVKIWSSSLCSLKDSTHIPISSTMTDLISMRFDVAGILGLALQLSPIIASYVNGVRHAPEHIQDLRQPLDALIKTLDRLDSVLKIESAKGPAFSERAFLYTTRDACNKRLTAISTKLRTSTKAGRVSQALHRFTWPLNAESTKAIAQDLLPWLMKDHRRREARYRPLASEYRPFYSSKCRQE